MKGKFDQLINSNRPVLIDFYADWCGPCKALSPIIKDVAKQVKGKVRVIKIDVDKNPIIASRYSIRSIPTLMFFKDGEVLWQQAGVPTKKQILDKILPFT